MDATLAGEMSADPDIGRDQIVPEERRRLILELLRERRSITVGAVERVARGKGAAAYSGEERAAAYGIAADELEAFYRERTTLKVNVLPADIAPAILFFASSRRSGKSTGNILNVDGGVALAYRR